MATYKDKMKAIEEEEKKLKKSKSGDSNKKEAKKYKDGYKPWDDAHKTVKNRKGENNK